MRTQRNPDTRMPVLIATFERAAAFTLVDTLV